MVSPRTAPSDRSKDSARKPAAPQPAAPTAQRAVQDALLRAAAPGAATPSDILALQRRVGNRAVNRLLASRTIQAKLTVGPASDSYEQEADRVAEQVMRLPASPRLVEPPPDGMNWRELRTKPAIRRLVQRPNLGLAPFRESLDNTPNHMAFIIPAQCRRR